MEFSLGGIFVGGIFVGGIFVGGIFVGGIFVGGIFGSREKLVPSLKWVRALYDSLATHLLWNIRLVFNFQSRNTKCFLSFLSCPSKYDCKLSEHSAPLIWIALFRSFFLVNFTRLWPCAYVYKSVVFIVSKAIEWKRSLFIKLPLK